MPETTLLRTLNDLRRELETASTRFDEASARFDTQVSVVRRLRVFFWLAVIGAGVIAIVFGLVYRESQLRIDQIQESRLASCAATEQAKAALVERDEELVSIAVEVAEGEPELAAAIIDRLNDGPSAEALIPLNCEEVVEGD